ncbi:hypothetical protein TNCT_160171 [Trichonephila clavata]|uniref:Uncharacterized protein n=1 Tax=Trichonephila clavata TaxID=2740835 RepID=A0A8X6G9G5_TRICU|nr:hypothetical protein TNCT_160171 [Trichonephila clavata]
MVAVQSIRQLIGERGVMSNKRCVTNSCKGIIRSGDYHGILMGGSGSGDKEERVPELRLGRSDHFRMTVRCAEESVTRY